jgi:pyruvate dehydrogenase E1 component beta subunit
VEQTKYHKKLCEIMCNISKIPNSIFLGQQVADYAGSFYGTLKGVPEEKIRELPIIEELQLGMSIGLALEGYLPISIFQRIDFLPRACDQLVNHLDCMREMTCGRYNPKVIIRTTVGSKKPLNGGIQHTKNLTEGFAHLLDNITVVEAKTPEALDMFYEDALNGDKSVIIVDHMELYNKGEK